MAHYLAAGSDHAKLLIGFLDSFRQAVAKEVLSALGSPTRSQPTRSKQGAQDENSGLSGHARLHGPPARPCRVPPHSLGRDMYTISKRFTFSASHVIGGLPSDHPCGRLHGHNYQVEVTLQSAALDHVVVVRDFHDLSKFGQFIDSTLDHKHLNDVLGHDRTTSEMISQWLNDWCKTRWPEVIAVRVSETPNTWAEYRP
jgi:6-pyruvoyltetrahydropterin/6-carboxytetrahydropterin synthase